MAIDMTAKLTAVGVGALDEVFEGLDEGAGRTEAFKKWTDFYRLGGTLITLVGEVMGRGTMAKLSRDANGPMITLLTKSIAQPVKSMLKERVGVRRASGSPPPPRPMGGGRAGWRPTLVGAG